VSESTELQRAVENLTRTIQELRDELVRKDVYAVDQKMMHQQINSVADDLTDLKQAVGKADDRRAADRRLLLTSFALPILILILNLYLAAQTGGPS
jgi:hypothetical protein